MLLMRGCHVSAVLFHGSIFVSSYTPSFVAEYENARNRSVSGVVGLPSPAPRMSFAVRCVFVMRSTTAGTEESNWRMSLRGECQRQTGERRTGYYTTSCALRHIQTECKKGTMQYCALETSTYETIRRVTHSHAIETPSNAYVMIVMCTSRQVLMRSPQQEHKGVAREALISEGVVRE